MADGINKTNDGIASALAWAVQKATDKLKTVVIEKAETNFDEPAYFPGTCRRRREDDFLDKYATYKFDYLSPSSCRMMQTFQTRRDKAILSTMPKVVGELYETNEKVKDERSDVNCKKTLLKANIKALEEKAHRAMKYFAGERAEVGVSMSMIQWRCYILADKVAEYYSGLLFTNRFDAKKVEEFATKQLAVAKTELKELTATSASLDGAILLVNRADKHLSDLVCSISSGACAYMNQYLTRSDFIREAVGGISTRIR